MSATPGAWDTHAHVVGDVARYPLAQGHTYQPPRASLDDYLALLDRSGLDYGVLVQPSVYGFDNSCMLDAIGVAPARLFGIAVPAPEASARDLEAMHERGVRGVRCNLIQPGGLPPDVAVKWRDVLRALDWHVELQMHVDRMPDLSGFVERFGVPVVIDHMGRPDRAAPAAAQELIALVRAGECFVKLSAPYRMSAQQARWSDVTALAHALIDASPAHCVWATDWPHTQFEAIAETDMLVALHTWCPDAQTRDTLLRRTPLHLYGAPPAA